MMKEVILIGAGIEVIEQIENSNEYSIRGIVDSNLSEQYYGYKILGDDRFLIENKHIFKNALISIPIDDTNIKEKLYQLYLKEGFSFADVICKDAHISSRISLGTGAIVMNGVNISAGCNLGICSKVNVNVNLMHNGSFGDFCIFGPNAVTLGYVESGNKVFFGSNSTILPRLKIGNNIIIGAGAVVTKNLSDNSVYAGNPARKIRDI